MQFRLRRGILEERARFYSRSELLKLFQILNGDDDDGKNLGRFCGNTLPMNNSIISDSSVVIIRFHSDSSKNFRGFQLNYTLTQPSRTIRIYNLKYSPWTYYIQSNLWYFHF